MMFTKYLEEDMKKNTKSDSVQINKDDNQVLLKQDSVNTKNSNIIKLPSQNYIKSLKNYLDLEGKNAFKKYKVFDYRIINQLILK